MQSRPAAVRALSIASLILGVFLTLCTSGAAWAHPGALLTHHKIGDGEGHFEETLEDFDEFGGAVANLGDLDGPGPSVVALAVGVSGEDEDDGFNRGAVYILFLGANSTVISSQKIGGSYGGFDVTLDNQDEFGSSLASLGDLDGAGPSVVALAVGAVGDDDGGSAYGAVYILFLDSDGSVLSSQKISATEGNFNEVLDVLNEFGGALASLGDLDGIGPSVTALAVGAVGDDDGGTNRGAAYVLFLDETGMVLSSTKISDTEGGFSGMLGNVDEFGSALADLGDLDGPGPGATALAVSAVGDDEGGSNQGAVYILFLDRTGSVLSQRKLGALSDGLSGELEDGDEFGGALANVGDLDGLGPSAGVLAVGSIGDDDGGIDAGAVYLLFIGRAGEILSTQKISSTRGGFNDTLEEEDEFGSALAALGDIDGPGGAGITLVSGAASDDGDEGEDRGAVYVLSLAGSVLVDASPVALGRVLLNPFGPMTRIPFRLSEAARVRIVIWDIGGRLVRVLVDEQADAGEHAVVWRGDDDSGQRLTPGAYFVSMSINGRRVSSAKRAFLLE